MKDLKPQRITITLSAAEADILEQLAAKNERSRDREATHMLRSQLRVAGFCQKGAASECADGHLCIGARVPYQTAAAFRKTAFAGNTDVEGLLCSLIGEAVERVAISPAEVKAFACGQ